MSFLAERKTLRTTLAGEPEDPRLDRFLASEYKDLSRGDAKKLIDLGAVHVNGRRIRKCSWQLHGGDRVEIFIDGLPLTPFVLSDDHIVFQDKYLLVINKPAGVDSQPTPSRYKGTLYAALNEYLKHPTRKDLKPTIGMVQRLDRDTSGLLLFSIHPAAHKEVSRMFQNRDVTKRYTAIVRGAMPAGDGEFRSQLARRRADNRMKSVRKGGQEAITRYRVIGSGPHASLVDVEIPTGRSHQIRAHFSEAGYPLLGDRRYGGGDRLDDVTIGRQMLHARQLAIKHPKSGVSLDFVADLPYDMESVVNTFFKDTL